jgi:hypothetical protein
MQSFVSSDYLKFDLLAIFPSLNLGIRKILALSSTITHLITKHIKLNIFFSSVWHTICEPGSSCIDPHRAFDCQGTEQMPLSYKKQHQDSVILAGSA